MSTQATVAAPQRAAIGILGSVLVAFGVFLSGFVINEPAPYEVYMAGLIGLWALFGLRISRTVAVLLTILVVFNIGGMISMLTMKTVGDTPLYLAVSLFLALSAVFFAAIIEEDYRRLGLIMRAYVAAAIVTALLGIGGYFGLIPGGEVFTRYERAMGAFQDPNVFGPYLVPPSLYLLHGILAGRLSGAGPRILGLLVLTLGIFLSFSRAAWGFYLVAVIGLVFAMLIQNRSNRFRLRIITLGLAGVAAIVISLVAALQVPKVQQLFDTRAQLVQDYDSARFGRFERHKIGFLMATEKPLGIGPLEFGKIYGEDTHNIWLKALMDYGWLGFAAYLALVMTTLTAGFKFLFRDRPWQTYLMVGYVAFVGHTLIGSVIDTDHWRHFYLLLGLVWGCFALEVRALSRERANRPAPARMPLPAVSRR